jgi:hypothetical protein
MVIGHTNVGVLTERGDVKGKVHRANCFIVTTRWPQLRWVPLTAPATCAFCARADTSSR